MLQFSPQTWPWTWRVLATLSTSLALALAVAGCGGGGDGSLAGGGGGGGGGGASPFEGSYRADFAAGGKNLTLLLAVAGDGTTESTVSDAASVLATGKGKTEEAGTLSIAMTGSAGATTLSGTFGARSRAAGPFQGKLTGGITAPTLSAGPLPGGNGFQGKVRLRFRGSSVGQVDVTITAGGSILLRSGSSQTPVGSVTNGGEFRISGANLVPPSTKNTTWTGRLFLTPASVSGSGSYQAVGDSNFKGTWTAERAAAAGDIVFKTTTIVKGIGIRDVLSVFSVSPNGRMTGFSGDKAAVWETRDGVPSILNPLSGNTIAWPSQINNSGAVVGYSYNRNELAKSKPVYWAPGSASPVTLKLPDGYTSGLAAGINNSGTIVGLIRKDNGTTKSCIWPSKNEAPILPPQGDAVRISDAGVVFSQANNGYIPNPGATKMVVLTPPPGYGNLSLFEMTPAGTIVGTGEKASDGKRHPIHWLASTGFSPVAMGELGDSAVMEPMYAGTSGTFVGRMKSAPSDAYSAVYWKTASQAFLLDDVVENNVNLYQGAQFIFSDGSILAYGKDDVGFPMYAWLQK